VKTIKRGRAIVTGGKGTAARTTRLLGGISWWICFDTEYRKGSRTGFTTTTSQIRFIPAKPFHLRNTADDCGSYSLFMQHFWIAAF
jgi:hypothetical protein